MEFSQAGCVGTGERDYGVQRRPERNVWRNAEEGISGVWCIVGTGARGDTSSRRGGASGARSDPQRDEGGPHIRRRAGRGFLRPDGELCKPSYELSSDAGSGAQPVLGEGLSPLRSEWLFGCALNFFQREKYYEGTDQGIWLSWRFDMTTGAPKFQFSGRSRSSGERFLCTPIKDVAEDIFTVSAEWNAKLGKRWKNLQQKLLKEILQKDFGGKPIGQLSPEEKKELVKKLNERMKAEWPKELKTDEEKALDKEYERLSDLLERVLEQPKVEDYEYRVLEKGVGVQVLVQDGRLQTTGGNLELTGRNRGLTETMLFRLAQTASGLWQDKKFHADDVTVETGWNDPKVKEFLTAGLRVPEGRIVLGAAGSLTAEKDLKLADAWFRVSALSTGKSLLFRATEKMLSPRYFELKGKGEPEPTAEEETRLAGLAQVSPFLGGFEVRDCPKDKGLNDVLYDNSLVFLGQDGSKEKLKLGLLVYELVKDANISSDVIFNTVTGFRAAQFASQAWSDGVFKPADASVTVGPMLRGTNPADFWKSLGVADVETSAEGSDNERLTVKIKIKSTGEIYTIAEAEDLGRRDYANLKAYADRIRPLAQKEKKGASVAPQTLAKAGMVSAFGEVRVMHDELKGWSGALHITEESMEDLIGRAIAVPSVGNFVVSKTTKAPVPPTPEDPGPGEPDEPEPETPKPETPKPETPKPETPKPETPKPETPKPETPKPETPKPETPKPEDPKPGPQTEKKGDSGGCDTGLLSFAALALVPMASRFGKKAR